MSVVPSGTSTTHFLYPGCYVVDPSNILQANVAITVKDSTGATLLPRGSASPYSLFTLSSSAGGFVPPVYLPSDGGPVLYSSPTIVPVSVACDEGITPGQFATLQTQVSSNTGSIAAGVPDTAARSSITAINTTLGTTPAGTYASVAARLAATDSSLPATVTGAWTYAVPPVVPTGAFSTDAIAGLSPYVYAIKAATAVDIIKLNSESRASTLVLVNDTDLVFNVAGGDIWDVDFYVEYEADLAADMKWAVIAPSGSVINGEAKGLGMGATVSTSQITQVTLSGAPTAAPSPYGCGGLGAAVACSLRVSFRLRNGATPGVCAFQWSQSASSAVPTIVRSGSNLIGVLR